MEETYPTSGHDSSFFHLSVLLDLFIFQKACSPDSTLQKSLSKFWSCFQSSRESRMPGSCPKPTIQEPGNVDGDTGDDTGRKDETSSPGFLCREEVAMVMGRIGLSCNPADEGGNVQEVYGPDEISGALDMEEATLEEAFMVFDGNSDGFIDAEELQRVLCMLGFIEGKKIEDCEKMIRTFDRNGDGKIDFEEFMTLFMDNEH